MRAPLTDKVRKRCQGRKASGSESTTAYVVSKETVSRSESGTARGAEHAFFVRGNRRLMRSIKRRRRRRQSGSRPTINIGW